MTETSVSFSNINKYYRIYYFGIGALLIIAAQLKAYEWFAGYSELHSMLGSSEAIAIIILLEAFLGLALVFNLNPKSIRKVSLFVFSLFSLWSGYAWLTNTTCGCFGPFNVYPLYMLIFDIFILSGFIILKPDT